MPRAASIQTNFTAGEVSPRLRGRVDLNKYQNGVQKLKNFIVKPQGGAFARPGTIFCVEVKDSTKLTLLVEFEFSDIQAYIIETGPGYMRFIKNHVQILNAGTPVEISTPYTEAELEFLQFAQSADVLYICHPSHPPKELLHLSDISWVLQDYAHFDGPYLPQNDSDITIVAFNQDDRMDITSTANDFAVGDVGKFLEFSALGIPVIGEVYQYASATLDRVYPKQNIIAPIDPTAVVTEAAGVLTSTVAIFSRNNIGSYIKITSGAWHLITGFTDTTHVTVGAALTMVATAGTLTTSNRAIHCQLRATSPIFNLTDTNVRHVRLNFSSEQVWGVVSGYTSTTQVNVALDRPIPLKDRDPSRLRDDGKTTLWRLGAWCETLGYPSCVSFHEERLCFAASPTEPQTIWMSVAGEYDNHAPTDNQSKVLDSSGIRITIASAKVNAIKWMSSGVTLVFGTFGSEWQIRGGSSLTDPITPTNISAVQHTSYGSGNVRPVRIGAGVLFVQRNGRRVRELIYDYNTDSLQARDLNIVSEHIFRRGVKCRAVAYQSEPNNTMWTILQDGSIAGLTYVRDQEVYAWHPHELGGAYLGGKAQAESIACVSNLDGVEDELYFIVKRTINGVTKRYIEYMSLEIDPVNENDKLNLQYVDCCKPYSGAAVTTVTTYTHLRNQPIQILANGAVRAPTSVNASGEFSFTTAATKVFAGLAYQSIIQNLPPEGGNPLGTAQGKVKRIDSIQLRLYRSMGFKYGPNENKLTQWTNRRGDSPMDNSPPLIMDDDVSVKFDGPYERPGQMVIVRDNPTPLNILSTMINFDTETG